MLANREGNESTKEAPNIINRSNCGESRGLGRSNQIMHDQEVFGNDDAAFVE